MKGIHFFLLIVTLPALLILGHDVYLFYADQGQPLNMNNASKIFTEDRPGRSFDFTALGFLWTNYSADSYHLMSESFEPAEWAAIQDLLKLKAFYVFTAFAVLMYMLAFFFVMIQKIAERTKKVRKPRRR
ncbi:MAG: hypothetical protein ACLFR0_08435 [Alphaproteobacteria bacterium]